MEDIDALEPFAADELHTDRPDPPTSKEREWLVSPHFSFPKPPRLPRFEREEPVVRMTTFIASFGILDE